MSENTPQSVKAPYFTMKRKGIASIISAAAVLLWIILWPVFPMEFYSLFFASRVGSNFLLVLIAVIITFPESYISSKALSADISAPQLLVCNIIGMVAFIHLYAIFKYDAVWWVILSLLVHMAASALIFAAAPPIKTAKIKNEKKRFKYTAAGIVSTLLSDGLYLLIFSTLIKIFKE